jgi:pimeloyl-ACP methyl ester carboxylesterase
MALIGRIMTKKTKEAIKATAAIVIAVLAIFLLWIYPLNQAGKIVSRPDREVSAPDPTEFNMSFDTLSFVTEDNIRLSGMILTSPTADSGQEIADSINGTVILLHGLFESSTSQMEKAAVLTEAGFKVIVYDQRGYGQSEGEYRSGGYFEGNDLQELLYHLSLEDRLVHPLLVWGEDHGATAALKAWLRDDRIDFVVAENPVVDGRDWQKRVRDHDDRTAPDIMLGIIWWWMKQDSGYEMSVDNSDLSDAFGNAMVNKSGKYLIIACGQDDTPNNPYIAELKAMGGEWMIVPCDDSSSLFHQYQDKLLPAVLEMVE